MHGSPIEEVDFSHRLLVILQKIWRGLCIFVAKSLLLRHISATCTSRVLCHISATGTSRVLCHISATGTSRVTLCMCPIDRYRATVVNAVNNIAAIIMNDICFCIRLRKIEIYIRVFYKMHLSSSVFFRKTILSSGLKGYQTY